MRCPLYCYFWISILLYLEHDLLISRHKKLHFLPFCGCEQFHCHRKKYTHKTLQNWDELHLQITHLLPWSWNLSISSVSSFLHMQRFKEKFRCHSSQTSPSHWNATPESNFTASSLSKPLSSFFSFVLQLKELRQWRYRALLLMIGLFLSVQSLSSF